MYVVPDGTISKEVARIVRDSVCGLCGRKVARFLNPVTKGTYIACSDVAHDAESIVKEWVPPKNEDTLNQEKQRRIDMTTEAHGQEVTTALMAQGLPMSGTLTETQATKVLKTIWPEAPEIEVWKAAKVCQDFGLHPLLKHVHLIKFGSQWTMVLGIGATRLMMQRRVQFSYVDDTPRIMSDEEQVKIFGQIDKDKIVAITRLQSRSGMKAQGYGKYPKTDGHFQGADKGNTRENMAFIRSERAAFARLSPDALPPDIDVVDERYVDTPSGTVDTTTGELPADGEFHETPDSAADETTEEAITEAGADEEADQQEVKPTDGDPPASPIDEALLSDARAKLKWQDKTIISFVAATYSVSDKGSLTEVLCRLTKDQCKEFAGQIQAKLEALG